MSTETTHADGMFAPSCPKHPQEHCGHLRGAQTAFRLYTDCWTNRLYLEVDGARIHIPPFVWRAITAPDVLATVARRLP